MIRRRRSSGGSPPAFDVVTEAVKVPRIAIVTERITKLESCAIISGAQIATREEMRLFACNAAKRKEKQCYALP
jgi:hypothetical protein